MAKTGSIIITVNSQNIANNTSNVTVKCYITTSGNSWRGDQNTGTCTINGVKYSFTHGAPKNSKTLIFEKTLNISHDSQGKKTLSASFNYDSGWCTASTSKALTTIPRNSIFSNVSGSTLGDPITINITRYNSSFTHKVFYKPSNLSTWTTISTSAGTSVSFTPALSLASNVPKATALTLNLKIETYNGTTKIGSDATKPISVSIPSNVIPTVDVPVLTRVDNGVPETWGVYVKVYSKVTVSVSGTGIYGSTIDRYEVTCDGEMKTTTGDAVTFGPFNVSGEKNISVVAIDSRGRKSDAKSTSIIVHDYAKPTLILEAYRSDSDMNKSNTGTYVTLKATYSCSSCGGKNSITSKEFYAGSQKDTTLASGGSIVLSGFSVAEEYYVTGHVTDSLGNSSSDDITIKINSSNVPIHVRLSKKGVGIGRYCTDDGQLQIAYDIVLDEDKTFNGIEPSNIFLKDDERLKDSGWIDLSLGSDFTSYSDGQKPRYRKIGKMVEIIGAVKPTKNLTFSSVSNYYTIANIPDEIIPNRNVYILCQGSSANIWLFDVLKEGTLRLERHRNGSGSYVNATTSTWFPFHAFYFVD